mmetsp:Transcript_26299/g.39824  ORF Transcript_26299/g.39824 Transcript_26299/m.39824 type:complete len:335 (-) Transcript_26299:718-1722(-)
MRMRWLHIILYAVSFSCIHGLSIGDSKQSLSTRRNLIDNGLKVFGGFLGSTLIPPSSCLAEETSTLPPVQASVSGEVKQLFAQARALESQGNMAAAQRLYGKVTLMAPRFIYGWSNLGNTQVALGTLEPAEDSYSQAIDLCQEDINENENKQLGVKRCDDLYMLLLNRGSLRLNNNRIKDALNDLSRASVLRNRPDAIIAQNLARAKELNGMYAAADKDYNLAISMTSGEVNPFWLRSALVKYQLGDIKGGFDLLKRVENRFPEAPEVRAAYATFLAANGEQIEAQRKYLEIPDRQRLKYVSEDYLKNTISWPPAVINGLSKVTSAVEKPNLSF